MELLAQLQSIIAADTPRMHILRLVKELALPDCWVAAGFVRGCVWDHVHEIRPSPLPDDIDVIWYDPLHATQENDRLLESTLRARDGTPGWSVKNQARMHGRNADSPYCSAADAMRYWPETATAVGVRLGGQAQIEVNAPFGLDDLFGLIVRPTPRFLAGKHAMYAARIQGKNWQPGWPRLSIQYPGQPAGLA